MTATLGAPLVTYQETALCDGPAVHEVVLITDGQRAYTYRLDADNDTADRRVSRTGVTLYAACDIPVGSEDCRGHLTWRLDTDRWGVDADARRLLTAYGQGVES